jgi:general stress protein YciG
VRKHQKQEKRRTAQWGNFKNDPERASEAGKKGGQNSHSGDKK